MRRRLGPDFPFAPRRLPFFYGWVVVFASTLGVLFSIPGQTMGVSVFTDPLLAATGLDRLSFSNAYLLGTLASAALLPRAGRLLDRLGVRFTGLIAVGLLSGVLLALSRVDHLASWLSDTLSLPSPAVAFGCLAVLFVGLRFSGQGVLTLTSQTMLARWFRRRRGLASAVSTTFVAFGFAAAPRLFDAWIAASGWRGAWTEIALTELLVMCAVVVVLFRNTPEACGLEVDGGRGAADGTDELTELNATRAEALRTLVFWTLSLGLAQHGLVLTGFTLHVVDLGAEAGLGRSEVVSLFLPMAVVSTASGALLGWLADRVRVRSLLLSFLGCSTVATVASAHLAEPLGYWTAAVFFGIAGGHFSVLSAVGHPRFFGRAELGAIAGASMSLMVIGSALGPSALALSRTFSGSYAPGLYACAALPAAIGLLALRARHPADLPPRPRG